MTGATAIEMTVATTDGMVEAETTNITTVTTAAAMIEIGETATRTVVVLAPAPHPDEKGPGTVTTDATGTTTTTGEIVAIPVMTADEAMIAHGIQNLLRLAQI